MQQIGERVEPFNDLDLIAVLSLLDREVVSRPDEYLELRPLLSEWKRDLVTYGPGTIDLKLDAVSHRGRAQLRSLLASVGDRVEQFGNSVPASVLTERLQVPGVRFNDYPVSVLRTVVNALRKLLLEE
jgi:hypothetical protein